MLQDNGGCALVLLKCSVVQGYVNLAFRARFFALWREWGDNRTMLRPSWAQTMLVRIRASSGSTGLCLVPKTKAIWLERADDALIHIKISHSAIVNSHLGKDAKSTLR